MSLVGLRTTNMPKEGPVSFPAFENRPSVPKKTKLDARLNTGLDCFDVLL